MSRTKLTHDALGWNVLVNSKRHGWVYVAMGRTYDEALKIQTRHE